VPEIMLGAIGMGVETGAKFGLALAFVGLVSKTLIGTNWIDWTFGQVQNGNGGVQ
tara:strand:+ start:736 stop:900 length:165 start_codon:yes stop_codon:yes gene_type:complete